MTAPVTQAPPVAAGTPSAAPVTPAAGGPTDDGPTRRTRRPLPRLDVGLELALFAVSAATALTLTRAFTDWSAFWTLLAIVAAAHAVCVVCRLARITAGWSVLVQLAAGAVVIGAVHYPRLTWFGLPSGSMIAAFQRDVRTSFGPFEDLVPPIAESRGFTVAFAIGLWLIAMFADLAAVRSKAPVQAVTAPVVVFAFSSVLLLGRHAVLASVVFVGAMVAFRLAVRVGAVRETSGPVGASARAAGTRAMWASGVVVTALVLIAGTLATRAVPTPERGLVDLRSLGRGPDSRVVESPLVSLDGLLGERSDEVLFRVRSAEPHYWRLTALDDFDGRSWSASARYRDLGDGDTLRTPWAATLPTERRTFEVSIRRLRTDWLPSPLAPVSVTAPIDLRYDNESSSIFVADGESSIGLDYRVTAEVPTLDRAELETTPAGSTSDLAEYLRLPADLNPGVRDVATRLTAGRTPFGAAEALESFFRSSEFEYDRNVDYRSSSDPLTAFLLQRRGFCQQFATAFAAMARSIGLPSRVAVGFTYGDTDDSARPGAERTWTVRGRYAHAWPEVFLEGAGWVAFEPTPGRGNPDAVGYSAVTPSQADADGGSDPLAVTTTTAPPTTVPGAAAPSTTAADDLPTPAPTAAGQTDDDSVSTPLVVLLIVVGVVALLALLVRLRIVWVRRRRLAPRREGVDPATRIAASWREACRDLRRVDISPRAAETPIEFGVRAARTVEVQRMARLGRQESDRRYRRDAPADLEAAEAEEISDEVREVVWSRLDRRERLLAELGFDDHR